MAPAGNAALPSGGLGASPFDAEGRLVGGRRSRPSRGPGPEPDDGLRSFGGSPAAKPLNWPKSGPIPISLTGQLPLSGGLAIGRRAQHHRKRQTVSGFDPVVRGRGLARLSRRPQPTTASELQSACVRWCTTLWIMLILLQRFQLPGQEIAVLLPVVLVWCVYGLVRGVLEFDRYRFGFWLGAAGLSALMAPIQYALVHDYKVSQTSWGLLLVTWLIFIFRLRDRRRSTYVRVLTAVLKVELWHAGLVIFFLVSQVAIPYQDYLANVVPENLLLQNYTLAYPFSYGSNLYRSNGWIGLETSFTSIQLAFGVLCALLLRRKMTTVLFLLAAIAATGAQSGVMLLGFGVVAILFSPMRWALARYSVMIPTIIAFLLSPLGINTVNRLTEGTGANSSTGQRSTVPYEVLWPQWSPDTMWVLLGRGAGSSQTIIENSHLKGVIVPTPLKLLVDYGVIGGLLLAAFLMFMFLGGPSRAFSVAMIFSYWTLQPATTQVLLLIPLTLFATWWTPRAGRPLEDDRVPSPNATLVPDRARSRTEVLT